MTTAELALPMRLGRGWIGRYGLLVAGLSAAFSAPAFLLLADQILEWFPSTKESRFGWLMGVSSIVGLVVGPIAGVLSDRTHSRFGARLPWVVAGLIVTVGALLLGAVASTFGADRAGEGFVVLTVAWMLVQVGTTVSTTGTHALVPDVVPRGQLGLVSGVSATATTVGIVVGTAAGSLLPRPQAYTGCAVGLLLSAAPFLLFDRAACAYSPHANTPRTPRITSLRGLAGVLPSGRAHTNYWWMFAVRILLTLSQVIGLFYLLYYLRDRIHYPDPTAGVLILTIVYSACVVLTAVGSGLISDRIGRRRPFVFISSLGVAAAGFLLVSAVGFTVVVMGAVVLGLSWGVYLQSEQALINEVLPDGAAHATHLAVMNLGIDIPNTVGPLLAAVVVTGLGGYDALYLMTALVALAGGFAVLRIRAR